MSDNGHRKTGMTLTTQLGPELRHPSYQAALDAARPALLRLYRTWHQNRKAQIAEFITSFSATHGHPPTAGDLAAGLEPPISRSAATWYLSRDNGHNGSHKTSNSIPDFSKGSNQGAEAC
jgi:hypothetical protein